MGLTPYYFTLYQGQESFVRAWLNDVPFYRYYERYPLTRTGPAVHLLVPGDNTFAIEIDAAPPEANVYFELTIDHDRDNPVFRFDWPGDRRDLPPAEWRAPFRFETTFTPPGDLFTPAWFDAPRESVPCEGTAELRAAVRRVHDALAAGDLDDYCAAMALKAAEYERAYPDWQQASAADMRADMTGFLGMDLRLRPLDDAEVHFEPRAGGRLAHARHLGGGTVIDCVSVDLTPDGERARLAMDLTFTRHRGAWKIVF